MIEIILAINSFSMAMFELNSPKQDGKNDDGPKYIENVQSSNAAFFSIFTIAKQNQIKRRFYFMTPSINSH